MKRIFTLVLILAVVLSALSGCGTGGDGSCRHRDGDGDEICDKCYSSVMVTVDFYAVNDLHGKFKDTDANPGVDELTTYLRSRYVYDSNVVFLSSGDMWQGSSESNMTQGMMITDWMNRLNFTAMTLGNHEYDWGEEVIIENDAAADFPFLGINIFDRDTGERVEYCDASVVIERGGIQIGIIGAMGDCYSSIAADKSEGIYIKTGSQLSALIRSEATRLRSEGVDYIILSLHDGYDNNSSEGESASAGMLSSYYDTSLSGGYVDLIFEAHTHKKYTLIDQHGAYHLQGGGENQGISHAEISINSVTGASRTNEAGFISSSSYVNLPDDAIVNELLQKYESQIAKGDAVLGRNDKIMYAEEIKQLVARLYYEFGVEKWGDEYDIVLGGGFISARSPYDLKAGEIKYSDVYSILSFDNNLVLCSVKGYDLKTKFFETANSNYYIHYGDFGAEVKESIDPNATYYIVTDTYSSTYKSNRLTEIERVEEKIFARDLFAEYIKSGGLTKNSVADYYYEPNEQIERLFYVENKQIMQNTLLICKKILTANIFSIII